MTYQLQALIARWRELARGPKPLQMTPADAIEACADELAAVPAQQQEEGLVYLIEVLREEDGRFCAFWTTADNKEAGSGRYSDTVVGALGELSAILLRVDEDKSIQSREESAAVLAQQQEALPPADMPVYCAHCEFQLDRCPDCGKTEWRIGDTAAAFAQQQEEEQEHDEEMVPHSFDARTASDDEIWCSGCEYHRDHPIHTFPAAVLQSPQEEPKP